MMENRVSTVLAMMHGGDPQAAAVIAGLPVETLTDLVEPKPENQDTEEADHGL